MIEQLVKLGPRATEAFVALKRDIDRGRYRSGARLPSENELVAEIGVSRTALRRAVACLTEIGLLDVRQGSGTYLREMPPNYPGARILSLMYRFKGVDLTEIQDYLLERGLLMCVYSQDRTHWDPRKERRFLERVRQEQHRALLAFCSPLEPRNDSVLGELTASGTRVVHLEHFRYELPDQEYLLPDYRRAGHMAAVELMIAGYERLMFVGINMDAPYSHLFETGFVDAIEEHNREYVPERDRFDLGPGFRDDPSVRERLIEAVRAGLHTGVACTSIRMAIMIGQWLTEQGVDIPQNAGLIAPTLIGDATLPESQAAVVFDRPRMLKRIINEILAPRGRPLQELVSPKLHKGATLRTAH